MTPRLRMETHWDPLGPAASREQIHLQGMDVELKVLEGATQMRWG